MANMRITCIFSIRFCLVCLVGTGIFFVCFQIAELRKSRLSRSWPMVPGVLNIKRGEYRNDINYSYEVNSKSYLSDKIVYGELGNRRRGSDWKRFSELENGSEIAVYYMPGEPSESILVVGRVYENSLKNAFFGVFFIMMGVCGLIIIHVIGNSGSQPQ